jgi:hypothetical protein
MRDHILLVQQKDVTLGLHLERDRDCVGGSRTAWCTDYGGGSAQPGDSGGESHISQINLPSRPKYMQMVKNGRFHALLAYKSPKTPFFVEKYFTKYNHINTSIKKMFTT